MLHGALHVGGDAAPAAGGADEELHQGQDGAVTVTLVRVDPVVNHLIRHTTFEFGGLFRN